MIRFALRLVTWPVLLLLRLSFFGALLLALFAYHVGKYQAAEVSVVLMLFSMVFAGGLQRARG